MSQYAHPETVVSTDWVQEHLDRPDVVIVEVNVDTDLYNKGHIPGAVGWSWKTQLCDTVRRDIISREDVETLLGESGADNDSTIVLYGDNNNWFAAWAFWQLKLHGHRDVRLMDGGRKKWELEKRSLEKKPATPAKRTYHAEGANPNLRAFLDDVRRISQLHTADLVDVRSPAEFSGEVLAPPGLPETCQRGGHIPGAANIPWSKVVNDEDGTFKSVEDIREIYRQAGVSGTRPIVTYCRIGERSSHSWFVLRYLLGYPSVRNYDGSWTEWGNVVGLPIERGAPTYA